MADTAAMPQAAPQTKVRRSDMRKPVTKKLVLLAAVARAAKAIWKYEENCRIAWLFNPARLMLVGTILAVIDLATFVGWGRALWDKTKNV